MSANCVDAEGTMHKFSMKTSGSGYYYIDKDQLSGSTAFGFAKPADDYVKALAVFDETEEFLIWKRHMPIWKVGESLIDRNLYSPLIYAPNDNEGDRGEGGNGGKGKGGRK